LITIGVDPHKQTHTAVAIRAGSGELLGEHTAPARAPGYDELLAWSRELDHQRAWAVEDCRHVSGGLERYLRAHGERVVRVPPKLMATSRKSARTYGKSDSIDALAVARAALADPDLREAHDDAAAGELKLLSDHRANLIRERSTAQDRLRWHLHDLWPELQIPPGALDREKWLQRVSRRLGRSQQGARVRIMRQLVRQIHQLTREANELEREIARLVVAYAPQLLTLPGCGALIAGRIIGETAGISRFRNDAQLARLAGVAPLDASSGQQRRHRLNRHGNRSLNSALHKIAVVQGRIDPRAQAFLARKQHEGKTRREALRALKRHLARQIFNLLRRPAADADIPTVVKVRGGKVRMNAVIV
jgi:transposase